MDSFGGQNCRSSKAQPAVTGIGNRHKQSFQDIAVAPPDQGFRDTTIKKPMN